MISLLSADLVDHVRAFGICYSKWSRKRVTKISLLFVSISSFVSYRVWIRFEFLAWNERESKRFIFNSMITYTSLIKWFSFSFATHIKSHSKKNHIAACVSFSACYYSLKTQTLDDPLRCRVKKRTRRMKNSETQRRSEKETKHWRQRRLE